MISLVNLLKQLEDIDVQLKQRDARELVGRMDGYRHMLEQGHLNQQGKAHLIEIMDLLEEAFRVKAKLPS